MVITTSSYVNIGSNPIIPTNNNINLNIGDTIMKRTFIAENGIEVTGEIIYQSPQYRSSKSFVDMCYDVILFAQNRLVKLTYTLTPDDEDNYQEKDNPKIEILQDYVVIPSLE